MNSSVSRYHGGIISFRRTGSGWVEDLTLRPRKIQPYNPTTLKGNTPEEVARVGKDVLVAQSIWSIPNADFVGKIWRFALDPNDCNDNGHADLCEIASGVLEDLNADNLPDSCVPIQTGFAAPDFDRDGDVDEEDLSTLLNCRSGPDLGPLASGCEPTDLDGDGDNDQDDFAIYQRCFSGMNNPADVNCVD